MQQEKFDKKLAVEEAWLRQGIKARRTRNEGRVRALLAMRRERGGAPEQLSGTAYLQVEQADASGRLVFEAMTSASSSATVSSCGPSRRASCAATASD